MLTTYDFGKNELAGSHVLKLLSQWSPPWKSQRYSLFAMPSSWNALPFEIKSMITRYALEDIVTRRFDLHSKFHRHLSREELNRRTANWLEEVRNLLAATPEMRAEIKRMLQYYEERRDKERLECIDRLRERKRRSEPFSMRRYREGLRDRLQQLQADCHWLDRCIWLCT